MFCFVASSVAERIVIEGTAHTVTLPFGVVPFKPRLDGPKLDELTSVVIADLNISGRFQVFEQELFDSAYFANNRVAYFLHGQYHQQEEDVLVEYSIRDVNNLELLFGEVITIRKDQLHRASHHISNTIVKQLFGIQGIFHTEIFYVSRTARGREVFRMDYDGRGASQVTDLRSSSMAPKVSRDKKTLYFVSYFRGRPGVMSLNLQTGRVGHHFEGINQVFRFDLHPSEPTLVMAAEHEGRQGLYLGNLNTQKFNRLSMHWADELSPAWSPDGSKMLFTSNRTGNPQVYLMNSNGADVQRATFHGNFNDQAAWSPDGDRVAYSGMDGGKMNIYVMNPDGSRIQQLTFDSGNNESPTWSPDGSLIAFSSDRSGSSQIYIMRKDGSGVKQITFNGVNTTPFWSHY